MLQNIDEKIEDLIKDALRIKYSEPRDILLTDIPVFDNYSDFIHIITIDKIVELVVKKLSGVVGPSGVDSQTIADQLLKFSSTSFNL